MQGHVTKRGCLGIALLFAASGCTWKSIVEPVAPTLAARPSSDVITVVDRSGRDGQIDPSSTLQFILRDGDITEPVEARSLCRSAKGVFVTQDGCDTATLIGAWDDIDAIEIKGFDGAGTTFGAIGITVAATTVVVLIWGVVATRGLSGVPSGVPSGGIAHDREPRHGDPTTAPLRVIEPTNAHVEGATPFFTPNARRRSVVALSVATDYGVCLYGPLACSTAAVRAGFLFGSYVELTGGARFFRGWGLATPRDAWLPIGGLGFHSALPRYRPVAFYLGFEGGGIDSLQVFDVRAGMRFSPRPEIALGIFPFNPTILFHRGNDARFEAPTSMEVSGAF